MNSLSSQANRSSFSRFKLCLILCPAVLLTTRFTRVQSLLPKKRDYQYVSSVKCRMPALSDTTIALEQRTAWIGNTYSVSEEWPLFFRGENGSFYFFETCDQSFEPKLVQESYTMTVTNIAHAYYAKGIGYAEYEIGALCIQLRARNLRGQIRSKNWTREHLSTAFNKARIRIFRSFELGYIASEDMRSRFIDELQHQIEMLFGGTPTVRTGICQGDIPQAPYKVQVLWSGTCVSTHL